MGLAILLAENPFAVGYMNLQSIVQSRYENLEINLKAL